MHAYNISASMQNSIVKMIQAEKVVFYKTTTTTTYYPASAHTVVLTYKREKLGLEIDFFVYIRFCIAHIKD